MTTTQNIYNMTDTWTDGSTYTSVKMNVTDTSSNAASLLMDLQVGSATKFNVDNTGALQAQGSLFSQGTITNGSYMAAGTTVYAPTSLILRSGQDVILTPPSPATLQLGAVDADTNASIVAQTIRSQGTLAGGTSDQAGKDWTFIASPGKGTGAGGKFLFQAAKAGSTGTVVNTPATVFTVDSVSAYGLFPAGTNLAAPLKFTSGTNLSTAAAGAVEFDGTAFYASSIASARQIVNTEQVQALSGTRTFTNNANPQAIFNGSSNGAITLAATTSYEFEMSVTVTGLSSSAHTVNLTFATGGSFTDIQYMAISGTQSTVATPTAASIMWIAVGTASAVMASATTTGLILYVRGVMRMSTGGTVTPQMTQVTNTAAAVVQPESFFRCWPVGTNTVTNVGNWS